MNMVDLNCFAALTVLPVVRDICDSPQDHFALGSVLFHVSGLVIRFLGHMGVLVLDDDDTPGTWGMSIFLHHVENFSTRPAQPGP